MDGKGIGRLENKEAVLKLWGDNEINYPHIYCIERKQLSVPVLSAYSERLFSEAGKIFDKKNMFLLLPKTGKQLLFLHHNIPKFPDIIT